MPVVAAAAVALSGCSLEVLNPGAIQDADLNTAELMPVLVAGASSEYNNIHDNLAFDVAMLTDEAAGTGSYSTTQEYRRGIWTWEDSNGHWGRMHEAEWSAGEAWVRLGEVLGSSANSSADAAKLFVLMGFSHIRLGEAFCDVAYDVGPAQPRTAAFDSAIVAFNQAITIGTAAGSSGAHWVLAARAGIAQAQLGRGDFAAANTAAQAFFNNGGTLGFVDEALYHAQANQNIIWQESWGRAEEGVYRTMAKDLADAGDPRTPYTKCGEWNNPTDPYPDIIDGGVTPTGDCTGQGSGAHQGADGAHAHYRQDKYTERGSNIPRATGTEMRLIQAEAALQGTPNYATFIGHINAVRAYHGLGALPTPTTMGSLSWPYDLTDMSAMAILDRERYAELWLTGRRLFDMDRWDHPFLNGGWVVGSIAVANRVACFPISKNECQQNPELDGSPACS
jgi:hypothetical protein